MENNNKSSNKNKVIKIRIDTDQKKDTIYPTYDYRKIIKRLKGKYDVAFVKEPLNESIFLIYFYSINS